MDMVLDVAYDYWGKRIATCSSDQSIKIFDDAGQKLAEWKAHSGSIWRVRWMHPEFGVGLASCSFDRKVCIWEEVSDAEDVVGQPVPLSLWKLQCEIVDARDSVSCNSASHMCSVHLSFLSSPAGNRPT